MKIGSSAWKKIIVKGARELDIHVQPVQAEQFARHASILTKWNQKINLTTIEDPVEMAIKHFLDAILPYDCIQPGSRLLDVGSGAGFPGIALKVMIPSLQVTLVDATRKKANFLKHVIRELGLKHIKAVHARIEDLDQHPGDEFNVIVSRAFSDLTKFVKMSLPYLAANGQLIAYKAKSYAGEISKRHEVAEAQGSQQYRIPSCGDFQIKTLSFKLPVLNLTRTLLLISGSGRIDGV